MGGQQSRREENESQDAEQDSWMNRVAVEPSPALIARLQEKQNQQASGGASGGGHSEIPAHEEIRVAAHEESRVEPDQQKNQAAMRQRDMAIRREEDSDRVREILAAKDAESAYLSKMISSVVVPDLPANRQTVCEEESEAVVKCYASLKEGRDVRCGKFVDILEECASNQ